MNKPSFLSYMEPQTRAWQDRVIAGAKAMKQEHNLYWFIAYDKNSTLAIRTPTGGLSIPVVNFLPDKETSYHWAHLMLEMALMHHPHKTLRINLTDKELLDQTGPWFVWGTEDHICPGCGGINADCICEKNQRFAAQDSNRFVSISRYMLARNYLYGQSWLYETKESELATQVG